MAEKKYLKILHIMNMIELLKVKKKDLLKEAVLEMRDDGYTYDQIAGFLKIGKITAMDFCKEKS